MLATAAASSCARRPWGGAGRRPGGRGRRLDAGSEILPRKPALPGKGPLQASNAPHKLAQTSCEAMLHHPPAASLPGVRSGPGGVRSGPRHPRVVTSNGGRGARRLRGIALWRKPVSAVRATGGDATGGDGVVPNEDASALEGDQTSNAASFSAGVEIDAAAGGATDALRSDQPARADTAPPGQSKLTALEVTVEQIENRLIEKVGRCSTCMGITEAWHGHRV